MGGQGHSVCSSPNDLLSGRVGLHLDTLRGGWQGYLNLTWFAYTDVCFFVDFFKLKIDSLIFSLLKSKARFR